ncbi:MAG: AMP-binding protein [Gammaproteobacteria bacterium]|nr:AMP-binding protein [Gammaproteobacteria bacterium]
MTLSYVSGTSAVPLLYKTIGEAFADTVERHGDNEAAVFVEQRVRLTYRELARRVGGFAAGLLRLGLQPGDRLGIWSPNRVEWLIAHYKIPSCIRFVEDFPMTVTGKFQKFVMRQQTVEELGIHAADTRMNDIGQG